MQYCLPSLKEVLKTMTSWTAINKAQDGIELLKLIQNAAHNQLETKHTTTGYVKTYFELITFMQGQSMSNNDHYAQFRGLVELI